MPINSHSDFIRQLRKIDETNFDGYVYENEGKITLLHHTFQLCFFTKN